MLFSLIKRISFRLGKRNIFRYFDGSWWRKCDPIQTWNLLKSDSEFSFDKHLGEIQTGDLVAVSITARAIRRAFKIKECTQGGLTDDECLDLLSQFFVWSSEVKKKRSGFAILPSRTELESLAMSTMKQDTDSGLTEPAPTSENQSKSQSELPTS